MATFLTDAPEQLPPSSQQHKTTSGYTSSPHSHYSAPEIGLCKLEPQFLNVDSDYSGCTSALATVMHKRPTEYSDELVGGEVTEGGDGVDCYRKGFYLRREISLKAGERAPDGEEERTAEPRRLGGSITSISGWKGLRGTESPLLRGGDESCMSLRIVGIQRVRATLRDGLVTSSRITTRQIPILTLP
ncbi:hypothetical protein PQX77_010967 [Marasmius sp. AFHP31]|nr:hypothetical protein PQX77_010967 [Marasmius sp. AFHP31]